MSTPVPFPDHHPRWAARPLACAARARAVTADAVVVGRPRLGVAAFASALGRPWLSALLGLRSRRPAGPCGARLRLCSAWFVLVSVGRCGPLRSRSARRPRASAPMFVLVSVRSFSARRAASAGALLRPRCLGPAPFGSLFAPLRARCLGCSAPLRSSAVRPCLLALLASAPLRLRPRSAPGSSLPSRRCALWVGLRGPAARFGLGARLFSASARGLLLAVGFKYLCGFAAALPSGWVLLRVWLGGLFASRDAACRALRRIGIWVFCCLGERVPLQFSTCVVQNPPCPSVRVVKTPPQSIAGVILTPP